MNNDYAAWAARWRVPLGFALGAAYLIFCQPTLRLLLAGAVVGSAGLVLRAWSAGCLEKNRRLATSGPYAYTRNPLYLGSSLLGLGFAVAGGSWILGAAFLLLFVAVYRPVILREETYLRKEFGDAYNQYAEVVPLFMPKIGRRSSGQDKFRWDLYRRNHEYEAALGYVAGILFLALKIWLR
jgi:protein-S-isoprenylcysteine O-methyltransferase Ste14